jgi:hypothetical protein
LGRIDVLIGLESRRRITNLFLPVLALTGFFKQVIGMLGAALQACRPPPDFFAGSIGQSPQYPQHHQIYGNASRERDQKKPFHLDFHI